MSQKVISSHSASSIQQAVRQNYQKRMSITESLMDFEQFSSRYRSKLEEKQLEQALVYLKLREEGCPKTKALVFAKKKEVGIDTTVKRDGPAGYRRLVPDRPKGMVVNGWLKGQKLEYKGLRGCEQEVSHIETKQRKSITKFHESTRKATNQIRLQLKQQEKRVLSGHPRVLLEQIGRLKDEFSKDRERRNLFLSCQGERLEQHTRDYFQNIEKDDPESFIIKFGAFEHPLNNQKLVLETDWESVRGRSFSSHEVEAENKRRKIMKFRASLKSVSPAKDSIRNSKSSLSNYTDRKFHTNLRSATLLQLSRPVRAGQQSEWKQFYGDIDKMVLLKTNQIQLRDSSRLEQ